MSTSLLRSALLPFALIACAATASVDDGPQDAGTATPRPGAQARDAAAPAADDAAPRDDDVAPRDGGADVPVTCPVCTYPGAPANAGTVTSPLLTEISGLAASRVHANVLYAHNDSGDTPRIFMMGVDGSSRNVVDITGAAAVDWEDIAVGPCTGGSCVFVADIGDNGKDRSDLKIYRIPEPSLTATSAAADTFPVQYPDGPHDAETLVVDGTGALYIVTKEIFGAVQLFALGVPGAAGTPLLARNVGKLTPPNFGIPALTGGDFFPGPCPRMVLRTYAGVLLFEGTAGEGPEQLAKRTFRTLSAPLENQGEAIAFSADGRSLFTASEGTRVPLYRFGCGP